MPAADHEGAGGGERQTNGTHIVALRGKQIVERGGWTAESGTILDNAVNVGGAVGVSHRALGQADFDDGQRVPVLAGPGNPVRRVAGTPESAGRVHPDHLEGL